MEGLDTIVKKVGAQQRAQRGDMDLPRLIVAGKASRSQVARDLADAAEALMDAAQNLHPWSRRYCDGRQTYAPGMHNDATRILRALRVSLALGGDGTVWARDGNTWPRDAEFDDTHKPRD